MHQPMKRRAYVAGHRGLVGSAIVRALKRRDNVQLVTRTHTELDLTEQAAVREFFAHEPVDEIYLAAARVGGIHANNTYPAEFIHTNLMVQANVIHEAWRAGVKKLLFLGSSCIYPRMAAQPIREEYLMSGALEPTNEAYAMAKIAGIKMCESYNRQYDTDYRSLMPTNLYGPGDNYHPENSHVIPALMRRFHEAVESGADSVTIWGSGRPLREFLHVDDLADACVHIMHLPREHHAALTEPGLSHINIGAGSEVTISALAAMLSQVTEFRGKVLFDTTKPDGTPRKLMDSSKAFALGWSPKRGLAQGLAETYQHFRASLADPTHDGQHGHDGHDGRGQKHVEDADNILHPPLRHSPSERSNPARA